MTEYLLTIQIPIKSDDDVGARINSQDILWDFDGNLARIGKSKALDLGFDFKLQEVYSDKKPRRIPIDDWSWRY